MRPPEHRFHNGQQRYLVYQDNGNDNYDDDEDDGSDVDDNDDDDVHHFDFPG